jgi:hypothetical protein
LGAIAHEDRNSVSGLQSTDIAHVRADTGGTMRKLAIVADERLAMENRGRLRAGSGAARKQVGQVHFARSSRLT